MAYQSNYSNLKYHPTVLMNIDDLCSAIVDGAFVQVQVVRQRDLTAFNPLETSRVPCPVLPKEL